MGDEPEVLAVLAGDDARALQIRVHLQEEDHRRLRVELEEALGLRAGDGQPTAWLDAFLLNPLLRPGVEHADLSRPKVYKTPQLFRWYKTMVNLHQSQRN